MKQILGYCWTWAKWDGVRRQVCTQSLCSAVSWTSQSLHPAHQHTPGKRENTSYMFRWGGKIFPSPARLRCHMERMVTDIMYREHWLSLSFLPFMGDQSREVCGFEGSAQQPPWTKAGVLLWAANLDFSWSLTSLCYTSSVLCSCWFYVYMGNTLNRMGWFHCLPLHNSLFTYLMWIYL